MKTLFKNNLRISISSIILLCVVLSVTSCKKDKDSKADQPQSHIPEFPIPSDADNLFVALKLTTSSSIDMPGGIEIPGGIGDDIDMEIKMGIGIAKLKGGGSAGSVKLNSTDLPYDGNAKGHINSTSLFGMTNPGSLDEMIGVQINNAVYWDVNNPTFTKDIQSFPGTPKITSGKEISLSGYTITHGNVIGADSIIYAIFGESGKYVMKTLVGSSKSCTFSADDLKKIGRSNFAIIEANAYKIHEDNTAISGEKTYFINENSYAISGATIK